MARFRDMRSFVRFVKDEHTTMTKDKESPRSLHNETPDSDWPTADEASARYAKKAHKSTEQVSDILDDCITFNYLRFSRTLMVAGHDFSLIVTSQGRHLLLRLGLIREIARDNSEWINLIAAFVVGALTVAVTGGFTIWVADHVKPPTVNNYIQNKVVPIPCTTDPKQVTTKLPACPTPHNSN